MSIFKSFHIKFCFVSCSKTPVQVLNTEMFESGQSDLGSEESSHGSLNTKEKASCQSLLLMDSLKLLAVLSCCTLLSLGMITWSASASINK